MKHIVLFKFDKNENKKNIEKILVNTYDKLKNEFNVIEDYEFNLNCLENANNMDLILFVDLGEDYKLETYINHPQHQVFLKEFKEAGLCDKAVIDV